MKDELNRLAKDIDAVEALWDGNLVFQILGEQEVPVPIITPQKEEIKSVAQPQMEEDHSHASINQNSDKPLVNKESISLLIIVQLPKGQTVPEEQRVFLRKMIKATNIPGSKMKYYECYSQNEFDEIWSKYSVEYWMFFGAESLHQTTIEDKLGIMVQPIAAVWNNIPIKQELWSIMKSYFGLT